MCAAFRTDEVATSQLPAMLLLAKMGWQPLTKAQANAARKTRTSAVILEDITRDYLRTRRLSWAGKDAPLSEDNIETLMVRLKNLPPCHLWQTGRRKMGFAVSAAKCGTGDKRQPPQP